MISKLSKEESDIVKNASKVQSKFSSYVSERYYIVAIKSLNGISLNEGENRIYNACTAWLQAEETHYTTSAEMHKLKEECKNLEGRV